MNMLDFDTGGNLQSDDLINIIVTSTKSDIDMCQITDQ